MCASWGWPVASAQLNKLGPHPLVELVSPLGAAGFLFFLGGPVASVFAWLGLPSVRCSAVSAVCPYAFWLFPVASVVVVLRVCLCARVLGCCICLACCCCTVYWQGIQGANFQSRRSTPCQVSGSIRMCMYTLNGPQTCSRHNCGYLCHPSCSTMGEAKVDHLRVPALTWWSWWNNVRLLPLDFLLTSCWFMLVPIL